MSCSANQTPILRSASHPPDIVIDKISITRHEPCPNQSTVTHVFEKVRPLLADLGIDQSAIRSSRRYRYKTNIPLPTIMDDLGGVVLVEFGARFPGIPDYRCEFNPSKLGSTGMSNLMTMMDYLFPEGGVAFMRNGRVTRLDIAIDLVGLRLDDVIARSKGQKKHGVFSDQHGMPQTTYFGSQKGNRSVVYDKQDVGEPVLRVERRMLPKRPGHELALLKDPFLKLQMILCPTLNEIAERAGVIGEHMIDSMRVRGVSHVVRKLSPALRRTLEEALKDPTLNVLPPSVWARWPSVLEDHGFGFLLPVRPKDERVSTETGHRCARDRCG